MTTRGYEALIILKVAGGDGANTTLEDPIKKIGGEIEVSQSWGRRRFAFKIEKINEGNYHLVRFSAPTTRVAEVRRAYTLNDAIVRFVILTQEEVGAVSTAETAPSAA